MDPLPPTAPTDDPVNWWLTVGLYLLVIWLGGALMRARRRRRERDEE